MLRQVLVHLEESLVVARQVGGEVVQVLLLLLPKEVAVLQAALEEVDLFLLHLFALPGVAPISHRSVGLDMEENEYMCERLLVVTLVGEEAMMLSAKLFEILRVNSYPAFPSSAPFIVTGSSLLGLSLR